MAIEIDDTAAVIVGPEDIEAAKLDLANALHSGTPEEAEAAAVWLDELRRTLIDQAAGILGATVRRGAGRG